MIERGEIDKERGARMKKLFDQYERHYRRTQSPEAAAAQASEMTIRELAAEQALKKRRLLGDVLVRKRALDDMAKYRGESPFAAIRAMMENDIDAPYENIELAAQAIEFDAHTQLMEFVQQHRRNFAGTAKDRAGLLDVLRERHGQATGNADAKAFSDAIGGVFEQMRLRFNAAGGAIGKLEHYFPHKWSTGKVRAVSYENFRAVFLPELDPVRMRDPITGGELTAERLEEVLRGTYDAIRTGGLTGEATAGFVGSGAMGNRRAEHRFLHFKDADAWLRVHEAFGEGDPFSAVMGHIRGMASDIATMERFGWNPDATVRLLIDAAQKSEAQGEGHSASALGVSGGKLLTENLWRYMKGESNVPIEPENWLQGPAPWISRTVAGTRNLLTSALLGSATLSAISDMNTQAMARKFNGLPEVQQLWTYLKLLNPASDADRKLAIRLGLGMRDASRSLMALQRYYGDMDRAGVTAVLADDVLRLSGLNKWTEAGQRAFGLDVLGTLGGHRGRAFGDLPEGLRKGMDRYGIGAKEWDAIRAAEPERSGGVEYVSARTVKDRRAADRLMQFVLGETQAAVQETTTGVRAGIAAVGRPGTWVREGVANSLQFKGYAASLMLTQGARMATLSPANRLAYAAQFFVGMTVFGYASIQLREIAKGRDPRPAFDEEGNINWELVADSALQGGGIGLFGDLIGSFQNDRISGWAQFIAGPFGGLVADAQQAVTTALPGEERQDGTRRPGNPGKAAIRLAKRYTPGTSLWYWRAAYEHAILDQLSEQIDPDYLKSRQRVEQWAAENGQGMWWTPGDVLPDRAPRMENAIAPAPQ